MKCSGTQGRPATRGPEGPVTEEFGDIQGQTKRRSQGTGPLHHVGDSLKERPMQSTGDYPETFPFRRCAVNAGGSSLTEKDKNEIDQRLSYFCSQETVSCGKHMLMQSPPNFLYRLAIFVVHCCHELSAGVFNSLAGNPAAPEPWEILAPVDRTCLITQMEALKVQFTF